jgi:hypothetical protein
MHEASIELQCQELTASIGLHGNYAVSNSLSSDTHSAEAPAGMKRNEADCRNLQKERGYNVKEGMLWLKRSLAAPHLPTRCTGYSIRRVYDRIQAP